MHTFQLSKQFYPKGMVLLFLAAILFVTAGTLNNVSPKPKIVLTKQSTALNINQNVLLFFSIGNKRLISDLLWVQTLLESDEVHYNKKDLNSWMYLRFMSISALDPEFYENYLYGGLYLSIVKDDVIGANEIFEKGLLHYPEDYKLNYYTGFNYYFEQGNFEEGLRYLEKVQNHPDAAPFLRLIVAKLKYQTTGTLEVALEFLKHEYEHGTEPNIKKKLLYDILTVQTEIDLKCLNSGNKNCNKKNLRDMDYIFDGKEWKSPLQLNPYKVHLRKR